MGSVTLVTERFFTVTTRRVVLRSAPAAETAVALTVARPSARAYTVTFSPFAAVRASIGAPLAKLTTAGSLLSHRTA